MQSDFNGELMGAVLVHLEETNLNKPQIYNRIKEWVTAKTISVRRMYHDAYMAPNQFHFAMMANDRKNCPAVFGGARII